MVQQENKKNLQIAIDGLTASGKSTIAKILASKLNIMYLDTGAMYRAFTYLCISNNIELTNKFEIVKMLNFFNYSVKNCENEEKVFLNNKDVTLEIRQTEITNNTSKISQIPEVREFMVKMQKKIAENNSIVMDGRDIGSRVLKNADYKFYINADIDIRAKRRYLDYLKKYNSNDITYEQVKKDIEMRDFLDTKLENSPMKEIPSDSIVIMNNLSLDEVIDSMLKKILSI